MHGTGLQLGATSSRGGIGAGGTASPRGGSGAGGASSSRGGIGAGDVLDGMSIPDELARPTDQINLTDEESRIMPVAGGGRRVRAVLQRPGGGGGGQPSGFSCRHPWMNGCRRGTWRALLSK